MKLLFLNIVTATFLLFSFHGSAQNPELFSHIWYFTNGELDGEAFFPTQNSTAFIYFYPNELNIGYPYCSGGTSFHDAQFNTNNTTFQLLGPHYILVDFCGPNEPNEHLFMSRHNKIYGDVTGTGVIYNPFTYTIVTVSNYFQLTITNADGDWAVYNSVLLSSPDFNAAGFSVFPNPVEETLQVSNASNQTVKASIYNVNGKKLQNISLESKASSIDVKVLTPGLYFVVFENEKGDRVSKKFVKK